LTIEYAAAESRPVVGSTALIRSWVVHQYNVMIQDTN
jgi:hypothetical protein